MKAKKEFKKATNSRPSRNFCKDNILYAQSVHNHASSADLNLAAHALRYKRGVESTESELAEIAPAPPDMAPPVEPK